VGLVMPEGSWITVAARVLGLLMIMEADPWLPGPPGTLNGGGGRPQGMGSQPEVAAQAAVLGRTRVQVAVVVVA
jgi:hypothetical protein